MAFNAHHCGINVSDTSESTRFYQDELGLDIIRQWRTGSLQGKLDGLSDQQISSESATSAKTTYLSINDFFIELVEYHTPPSKDRNTNLSNNSIGRVHLCFTVSDIADIYQRLKDRIEFLSRPIMTSDGGFIVKCYDSSGTLIEFFEPPDAPFGNTDNVIDGFHHYGLNTNDLSSSIEFFRATFGWELRTRYSPPQALDEYASGLAPNSGLTELAFMDAGTCEIELLEYQNVSNMNGELRENDVGRPHFAVRVDNIDAAYETTHDLTFLSEPQTTASGATLLKCRTSDGYTLEFIEPPAWLSDFIEQ